MVPKRLLEMWLIDIIDTKPELLCQVWWVFKESDETPFSIAEPFVAFCYQILIELYLIDAIR